MIHLYPFFLIYWFRLVHVKQYKVKPKIYPETTARRRHRQFPKGRQGSTDMICILFAAVVLVQRYTIAGEIGA